MQPFDDWMPARIAPAVQLTGDAAAAWMLALGWEESRADALRIAGDVARDSDFSLARVQHSPGRVEVVHEGPGLGVLLVAEGELRIHGGNELVQGALLFPTPARFTLESATPFAVVEIVYGAGHLGGFWMPLPEQPTVVGAETTTLQFLLPTAIAAVESRPEPDAPSWPLLREMLATLIGGLVVEVWPSGRGLVHAAVEVIARNRDDADVDVPALAAELEVTVGELEAAFEATGRTAGGMLRAARAAGARAMLARRQWVTESDLEAVAELAGFTTAGDMLKAVGEDPGRSLPAAGGSEAGHP